MVTPRRPKENPYAYVRRLSLGELDEIIAEYKDKVEEDRALMLRIFDTYEAVAMNRQECSMLDVDYSDLKRDGSKTLADKTLYVFAMLSLEGVSS